MREVLCKSCSATFRWAVTEATGALMPLDAEPTPDGNLAVRYEPTTRELLARVLKDGEAPREGEKRGTSHFTTCPAADEHRRRTAAVTPGQDDLFGSSG